MFRRRIFRKRPRRRIMSSITHIPSSMGNGVAANTAMVFLAANAGALNITGTAATTAAYSLSNREQENTVGGIIDTITFDISFNNAMSASVIEYAVFKIERASAVPALGTGLPTSASILASGLQQALRIIQPGRVVKFGTLSIAPEQPATRHVVANFKKYRMNRIRQGDWYGIIIFNGSANSATISVQARYKEKR